MNPQLTDHGCLHDDCDFYEVAEEFGIDESNELGDHDFAEAPQISSGGHVREHSDSQRLPHRPKEDDDLTSQQGPTSDILTSQEEEEPGDQKSLVEETKETSTLSQNPQDQQEQQSPFVKVCSDPHLKEEEVGKKMAEDIEHPTADHEGKALQEVDGVGNSQSIDSIKSTVEEQGAMPPILCSLEEKQQSDPKNLVEEIKEASIPSQNPQDQLQQQQPEVGKMTEEDIEDPTVDHEGKSLQEVVDASNSHFINSIKSTVTEKRGAMPPILCSPEEEQKSDPNNLVEEIKEASIPSQNPQDQQQQQPPEVGKMMEGDIEHPTADHEGKSLQEVDDVGNSQSIDNIKLTVEEQGAMPPILCSLEEKQQSDPKHLVEEIKEASIPSPNPQDQQQQHPPEVGKMMEEDIQDPITDHEGKALQEVDDAGNSHFINIIKSSVTEKRGAKPTIPCSLEQQSDPNNLVEEIKEASIPSQNPQDQQQQQPPEVGKMMEGDIEHPTADHEGKSLQEVDDVGNSQSIDKIKSTVEEQGTMPPILYSLEEKQQSDPKKLVEEIKEASIPSQNPQDQQQQQPPEVGKMMEEDIEDPTTDHEGKALQGVDDAGNSHFINSIKSTVTEKRGAMPLILCSPEEEQQSDPKKLAEEIKEASIPSQNPQDQQQQQPPEVGKMMEEDIEHPTADHEGKALQEIDDAGNSHFINRIKSTVIEKRGAMPPIVCSPEEEQQSDPNNLVKEIQEASIPSQNPQDQQQQQPPEVGKMMEEAIEHPTADHEGKALQEVGDAGNSHPINSIKSTVEEQGAMPPILCLLEEKQQSDPKKMVEEIKEASIPSKNLEDQQQQQQQPPPVERLCSDHPRLEEEVEKAIPPNNRDIDEKGDMRAIGSSRNLHPKRLFSPTKTLLSVIVSTFALIMIRKLLPRPS